MTAAELARAAEELGIDVIGAAPAEAYDETEQHIRERRERGLFAGMKFTMAQPEVSCHPELLLDGEARTVVSAALCYWVDAPDPAPGEGRLPRYAWLDHYALLRERLDALGRRLGGRYRVLVDENQHVDREGARRAGVGFYGKNTMMITREHGSWVVLGTLVTDVEIEATPPLDLDCGRCRLCIDACPTGRARRARRARREPLPLVLDAGPGSRAGAPTGRSCGASVYGCDICQDVCPWNRGIEKRRADRPLPADAAPNVSLLDWLTRDGAELDRRGRPPLRPAQRPALAAAERAHRARQHRRPRTTCRSPRHGLESDDPMLADDGRLGGRADRGAGGMSGDPSGLAVLVHEIRSPVAALVAIADAYPGADERAPEAPPRARRGRAGEHRAAPRRGTDGHRSAPSGSMPAASRAMPPRRRRSRAAAASSPGRRTASSSTATPSGCDRRSTT